MSRDARHPDVADELLSIGSRISARRRERGLTQDQLAERVALTSQRAAVAAGADPAGRSLQCDGRSVSRIESARHAMSVPRLLQVARALGVHPAVLLGGRPPEGWQS